jgi:hypothetical protein
MWALREAASRAGHYATAVEARDFYGRLAAELDAACSDGRLNCLAPRATLSPPFRKAYVADTARSFWKALLFVVELRGLDIRPGFSWGNAPPGEAFRRLIRGPLFPFKDRWILDGEILMGPLADAHADFVSSDKATYSRLNQAFGPAGRGTHILFQLVTDCVDASCALVVRDRRAPEERFALSDCKEGVAVKRGALKLVVKTAEKEPAVIPYGARRAERLLRALGAVGRAYRVLFPLCVLLGSACYVLSLTKALRRRQGDFLLFVGTALLVAVVSRLLLLAYMDATVWPTIRPLYCSPVYPLLLLFCGVAVAGLVP